VSFKYVAQNAVVVFKLRCGNNIAMHWNQWCEI